MRFLSIFLIFLQIDPAFGSLRQAQIVRGSGFFPDEEHLIRRYEGDLKRWLENQSEWNLSVELVGEKYSAKQLSQLIESAKLHQGVNQMKGELSVEADLIRKKFESTGIAFPIIQKSYVKEAVHQFSLGNRKKAEFLVRKASALHPLGSVGLELDWDAQDTYGNGFASLVERVEKGVVRRCRVRLEHQSASLPKHLWINGFKIDASKTLDLNQRSLHRLSETQNGDQTLLPCQSATVHRVILRENPEGSAQIVSSSGQTYFLVQKEKGDLLVSAIETERRYSQLGKIVGALSAEKELVPNWGNGISKSEIRKFLSEPQWDRISLGPVLPAGHPEPFLMHGHASGDEGTSWYKHWAFWSIVGGILVGSGVAYFATKRKDQVGSSHFEVKGKVE